ncbi:MAG: ornithine carbamoyltransferase [Smithellaceae bacterium]|nr:ornithine carbamoyltransferase [Smithellaceae bacterium]
MKKDLLTEDDLELTDFTEILDRADALKRMNRQGVSHTPLRGKGLGMIFDKASTRTRISFEVGMFQLGGLAVYLNSRDTQVGRGESIADSARVMSRYLHGLVIRTSLQRDVEEFARHASIPVINGLTDFLHPCQILSDLFTIREKFGGYEGIRVAYIGDGNNVANSWLNVARRLPIRLTMACPPGYDPDREILERATGEAQAGFKLSRDPAEAVAGAQVVYTDTWASMGQEDQKEERIKAFASYQVNEELLRRADPAVLVMHCLPAYRGQEISASVMDGPRSVIYDQAENRLHVQKAILEMLMA